METWNWQKQKAVADDILDAARTIEVTNNYITMGLTDNWVPASLYLQWANNALVRQGDDGWDTAASLAKRSVCRQMDGILVHNHLGGFLGKNYKEKAALLKRLGLPGLMLLRDLVIDPRNDIEHSYQMATENQARKACDVAQLFLLATQAEAATPAILGLGWGLFVKELISTAPGKEFHTLEIGLRKDSGPRLLVTHFESEPEVIVLIPADEILLSCPLKGFDPEQALTLNSRLRECLKFNNYSVRSVSPAFIKALREELQMFIAT